MLLLALACTKDPANTDDSAAATDSGVEDCTPVDESCNELDDDCDGNVDEGVTSIFYVDGDLDGYGSTTIVEACAPGEGVVEDNLDCNDSDASVNPGATEVCNGVDDDCDGLLDDSDDSVDLSTVTTWYADDDGDGFGDAEVYEDACTPPSGWVEDDNDCDDTLDAVHPDADEVCDDLDNNCDGDVDEPSAIDAGTWYADTDGDGFGDATDSEVACDEPVGRVDDNTDCDDSDKFVNPDADEVCDDVDNNCDGVTDDDAIDRTTWYDDGDGDGYGNSARTLEQCDQPSGYVDVAGDCDDSDGDANPGADEYCDGHDDDCDGDTDEDDAVDATTWYQDSDGDGYGGTTSTVACDQPSGYESADGDCDDSDDEINPDADEVCDGTDNDCDTSTSEDDTVLFTATDGTTTDLTTDLTGSSSSPADYTLSTAGDVVFCDGTFYVNLDVEADVNLESLSGVAADVVLDGASSGSVIDIDGGYDVSVSDLTIQDGFGDQTGFLYGGYTGGGGIACLGDGSGSLAVDNVVLQDNYGSLGANTSLEDCDAVITDTTFSGGTGTYGGAGFLNGSTVLMDNVTVSDNTTTTAAAFYLYDSADVEIEDSTIDSNDTSSYGTIYITQSDLYAASTAFTNNTTGSYGEVIYNYDSTSSLDVDSCDFGTLSGGDDNSDGDADIFWYNNNYEAGDNVSLDCSSTSCGTDGSDTIGGTSNAAAYYAYGDAFLATSDGSLESFSHYMYTSSSCTATFYVAAASSLGTSWTVEWVSSATTVSTSAAWVSSGDIDIALESGRYYALFVANSCGSSGLYHYYYYADGGDPDWGTSQAYVYNSSAVSGAVGDTITMYNNSSWAIFGQKHEYTTY